MKRDARERERERQEEEEERRGWQNAYNTLESQVQVLNFTGH